MSRNDSRPKWFPAAAVAALLVLTLASIACGGGGGGDGSGSPTSAPTPTPTPVAPTLAPTATTPSPTSSPTPAASTPSPTSTPTPAAPSQDQPVSTTVEGASVYTAESWPPQFFVHIIVGGCPVAEVEQVGTDIAITVRQDDDCPPEHRVEELVVPLGSDFEPGTYTVWVNGDAVGSFTAESTDTALPTVADASVIEAAYDRLNEGRLQAGLREFMEADEDDSAFIPIINWIMGCFESVDLHADLMWPDIHAISLAASPGGSECALKVTTYHYVPDSEKMRVERSVWECFAQSRNVGEADAVSCGGRYSFINGHVKWLPNEVFYTIVEGEDIRGKFVSHIPWVEERLKVKVSEAASAHDANLFLHLGVESPANCPKRYGCNVWIEDETGASATIYISAPDEFFDQVLKHELLHALLPMGHLPAGDYLMSISPDDPELTQSLSLLEEKLLELYTHPYLRNGMTMEQFSAYLIID